MYIITAAIFVPTEVANQYNKVLTAIQSEFCWQVS